MLKVVPPSNFCSRAKLPWPTAIPSITSRKPASIRTASQRHSIFNTSVTRFTCRSFPGRIVSACPGAHTSESKLTIDRVKSALKSMFRLVFRPTGFPRTFHTLPLEHTLRTVLCNLLQLSYPRFETLCRMFPKIRDVHVLSRVIDPSSVSRVRNTQLVVTYEFHRETNQIPDETRCPRCFPSMSILCRCIVKFSDDNG